MGLLVPQTPVTEPHHLGSQVEIKYLASRGPRAEGLGQTASEVKETSRNNTHAWTEPSAPPQTLPPFLARSTWHSGQVQCHLVEFRRPKKQNARKHVGPRSSRTMWPLSSVLASLVSSHLPGPQIKRCELAEPASFCQPPALWLPKRSCITSPHSLPPPTTSSEQSKLIIVQEIQREV